MVSCWVLLKKPLPVEAAISKNGCKPHLCQCAIPHLCQTTQYFTKQRTHTTIPYLLLVLPRHTYMPCHTLPHQSAKISANHTNTTPSLYIIKGFRNYQPLVTTISQDSCAYLQLTTLILVQCTQSKHRVAEGAISHRFRLRLVVAV